MIPDAHCHLSLLSDPARAVEEAVACGVSPILAVSMDAGEAEDVLALRDRFRGQVLAGVGLHPSRVVELTAEQQSEHLRRVEALIASADFVGEIGLDYRDAHEGPQRSRQREVFQRLLEVAAAKRLPVNLHTRRADREVLEAAIAFHEESGLGALLHWFTHSRKLARACAGRGIFISAGPSVLAGGLSADVAASIDSSILLIETDSPVEYPPMGEARPAWASSVLDRLVELRRTPADALARSVEGNLARYLGRGASTRA